MPLLSPQRRARLADSLWAAFITLVYHALRLLPARVASNAGERLSRRIGPAHNPGSDRAAKENLRRIRPEDEESGRTEAVARMWGLVGRLQAETAVIDRMWSAAQISVRNEASVLRTLATKRPIVFVFAHLGNWELLAIAAQRLGTVLNVVYEFLPERFELELALRARASLGYRLIPPNRAGVRQMLAALGRREAVALAIDEFKGGNVIAPPLGRPPRAGSNAEFAAKLARRFEALVIPAYCLRSAPFAFELTFLEPLERPDAAQLNALCETWIRAHAEQWYMLPRLRI